MHFKRLTILLFAMAVAAPVLKGADFTTALRQAEAAIHDGLYEQAASKLAPLLSSKLSPADQARAILLQAHVLYGLKDYTALDALLKKHSKLLKKEKLLGDHMYWQAQSANAQGQPEAALSALDTLPEAGSALYESAHWLKARLLLQSGQFANAAKVYNQMASEKASTRISPSSLLHWAKLLIGAGRLDEAELVLAHATETGNESEQTRARYWTARLLAEKGSWAQAETLFKEVTTAQTAGPELLGQAWHALADGYLAGGSTTNALLALKQGEQLARDRGQVLGLQLKQLTLHIQQDNLEEAETLVRKLIAEHGDHAALGRSLLILGESRLEGQESEKALKLYQDFLDVFSDEDGRARAMAGKGWACSQQKDSSQAAEWFAKAAASAKQPALKKQNDLYAADALFSAASYEPAREAYLTYARNYPGDEQQPQALFQAALCLVELNSYADAALELKRLAELYPDSDMAQRAELQLAMLKERQNDYRGAIALYDQYLAASEAGAFTATVRLNKGMALYRLGDFGGALSSFRAVAGTDGESEIKERAMYLEGWATYLDQGADKALPLFTTFIQAYPDSEWAEHVLFWQAETHFNQRDYSAALAKYSNLVEQYPDGELLEKALYWAGRSAMNLKEYVQAIQHFKRVVDDFPESARRADALFWEGDALTALGEFDAAVLVFDRLIKEFDESYLVCSAWGRKGDCYFILADKDPSRYEQALEVYTKLSKMGQACSKDQQLQALYKQARVVEALERRDEALHMYEQVVYDFLEYRSDLSRESTVYFSRSAFAAAQLHEREENWRQAIALYKRVRDARVEASNEADQRIQKIRVENLVLF